MKPSEDERSSEISMPDDDRWGETAHDASGRYPEEYWCVADDGWAQYFWGEQTVSREEYLANS
jgi:hypothetical protein